MIRVAIDSDNLGDLPAGVAPILMTYADLISSHSQLAELQQHHAGSQIVLFDRGLGDPLKLASVADVERFALKPANLPLWFDEKTAADIAFLTVYCDQNTLPAVDQVLAGTPYFDHWRHVARLDGIWNVPGFAPLRRPALVQVANAAMLGIHGDGSIVLNPNWHPGPPAAGAASTETDATPAAATGAASTGDAADPFPPESRPRPA